MKKIFLLIIILCSMVLHSCNTVECDYQRLVGAKIEFANPK